MRMTGTISLAVTLALVLTGCDALTATDADSAATDAEASATGADAAPAKPAAAALDMGTNTSSYANDGECDDPRFAGNTMAVGLQVINIGKDAADCQAALDAGTITLDPLFATPASDADIIYGDDSGDYTNDGECDDVRFTGDYVETMFYIVDDIGHDATDCRNAVESGEARWQGNTANPPLGLTE